MDGPEKVILDISSDEEVGWGDGGVTSATDCETGGRDDGDWLAELLEVFEEKVDDSASKLVDDSAYNLVEDSADKLVDDSSNEVAEDSDEVVVVDEILPRKKRKVEKRSAKWESSVVVDADDDDDECVVLDGDPDKPVEVNDGGEHDDADELLLVSEKGQVACRDYPHPRHLCVKFSFSSSPHEMHCHQCHCYVCDSLAPCVLWGTGISSIDHCHATDKEEFWKSQRKSSKNGGIVQSVVPNVTTDTSLCVGPTDIISQSAYPVNNVQNQGNYRPAQRQPVYRPTFSTASRRPSCPMPADATMPRGRMPPLSQCSARSKYHEYLASHKLQRVGNANPRPWKSPGTAGRLMTNNHYNNAPRNSHPPATRWQGPRHPAQMQMHQINRQVIHGPAGPCLSTHPSMGNSGLVTPHASPHSNGVNDNMLGPWSQWISQSYVPNISGPAPMYPIATQPHYNNHMLIHCQTASQSNAAQVPQNPFPYQPQMMPSSENIDNSLLHPQPLSNPAEASQNPVHYPHHLLFPVDTHTSSLNDVASVYPQPSFTSLIECQISNQIQQLHQLHSQSKEGNENIDMAWNGSHTNENIAGSSQQLNQTAIPASPNGDLKMLVEAMELETDEWFHPHDTTLGLDSLDIPLPDNIHSPESCHINDSSLFDF